MEAKSATALPPVSTATTSSPEAVLGGGGRVDLESKDGQALQNPRPSHHEGRQASMPLARLHTCWSLGKLSFNFKTIC